MITESPGSTVAPWPCNAWYVACTSDEIDGKPLGRKICNERMVFFRRGDGTAVALEDFCPHRGAPLSLGFMRDGELVCGYHGLTMGCKGRTVSMPGQKVNGFPAIRAFPVIERYGFIWVWPGEAEQADPGKLHHLEWAESDQMGLWRRHFSHQMRLSPDDRQSHGLDP